MTRHDSATADEARLPLAGLPLAIVLCAAVDVWLTRLAQPHRPAEVVLLVQSLLLWGVAALLALVPSFLTLTLAGKLAPARWLRGSGTWVLLFWTALPVVAHAQLDRHTAIGGDFGALAHWRPWVELLGASLALALAVVVLAVLFSTRGRRLALGLAVLALAAFLPRGGVQVEPVATAPPADARNVLLLVWDTTRAESLPVYGHGRNVSPHLAEFAQDALVFDEARSASVFTFSSHLTMLTGAFPSQHGGRLVHMRHDPERTTSVARLLHDAGYRTGAFVGTSVLAAHTGIGDGFEVYDDLVDPPVCDTRAWALVHDLQSVLSGVFPALRRNGRPHWFQDFQRPADDVLERAEAWIENGDERPWFCFVNLYDTHWPYLPNEAGRERWVSDYSGPMNGFGARSDELWGAAYAPTEEDEAHMTELYEAEIWELDAKVARFLEALDPDDAVLITADHGEAFGEAGVWEHDDLYEPQVRVPFVLRVPGATTTGATTTGSEEGTGSEAGPVMGVDVAPTLLGAAGLEVPAGLPGLDLTAERPGPERTTLVEDRDLPNPSEHRLALYSGTWKLEERRMDGALRVRLFDLTQDPVAEHDVSEQHPELVQELLARLHELRASLGVDATGEGDGGPDAASLEALKALGYLDK